MSYARNLALVYARNDLETGVAAADPHKLVLMLFDGAIKATQDAAAHLAHGDVEGKARAIGKAVQIVEDGLRASLVDTSGGELAGQLDRLYDYIGRRLLHASARNDITCLDDVRRLLGELRGAWMAIATPGSTPAPREQRLAAV